MGINDHKTQAKKTVEGDVLNARTCLYYVKRIFKNHLFDQPALLEVLSWFGIVERTIYTFHRNYKIHIK